MFYKYVSFSVRVNSKGEFVTLYYEPRGFLKWLLPKKVKRYWKNDRVWRNMATMEATNPQTIIKLNDIKQNLRLKEYMENAHARR